MVMHLSLLLIAGGDLHESKNQGLKRDFRKEA